MPLLSCTGTTDSSSFTTSGVGSLICPLGLFIALLVWNDVLEGGRRLNLLFLSSTEHAFIVVFIGGFQGIVAADVERKGGSVLKESNNAKGVVWPPPQPVVCLLSKSQGSSCLTFGLLGCCSVGLRRRKKYYSATETGSTSGRRRRPSLSSQLVGCPVDGGRSMYGMAFAPLSGFCELWEQAAASRFLLRQVRSMQHGNNGMGWDGMETRQWRYVGGGMSWMRRQVLHYWVLCMYGIALGFGIECG